MLMLLEGKLMDNLRDKMSRVVETRKEDVKLSKEKYNKLSEQRLFSILQKKNQTSFIGALSQFEQEFGFLWGHGKDPSEKTYEEKIMWEKWNKVRTNILNNGNNQIRAIQQELPQYTITWNGYHLEMKSVNFGWPE
jgi:hypothetical protein